MAAKRSASAPKKNLSASSELLWRSAMHVMIGLTLAAGVVALFRYCRQYVDQRLAYPARPPRLVLANRPPWMSDFLADQIIRTAQPIGLRSSFDREVLANAADSLKSNPWIRQIKQVRRTFANEPGDTVELDCEYRAPAALVKWGQFYWLVDGQAVILPEQYSSDQLPRIIFGPDGKVNIRIIEGESHGPVEFGRAWPGDDVAGGLELCALLAGRPYAEQIRQIDVSNFGGQHDRRAAQIVLVTQFGTQIRWGRPPQGKDGFAEVAAATKLAALRSVFEQTGRVDAGQAWIDIRFDRVTRPGPPPHQPENTAADAGN
jgi:hypothetical protein